MIHHVALFLYIGAFLLWLRSLLAGTPGRGSRLAGWVATAGVLVHLGALAGYTSDYGELPLVGLAPSLSSLALVVAVGLAFLSGLGEASRVGLVLIPLVIVLEASALALGIEPAAGTLDFRGAWFSLHVTLAFVGYGGLALAAAAGLLYLIQFHELKGKRLGRLFRFIPPLPTLDRLLRVGLVAGFITFSLALALGWAWTVRFRNTLAGDDPKVLWAVLTWLVFVAALAARIGSGSRERRSALATVVGFGLIVASYVVLRLALVGGGAFL